MVHGQSGFSANSLVPRQLTNLEKSRRTEKELIKDVAEGKYCSGAAPFARCRPSGSPTRSSLGKVGLRLSPLKIPRDAHQSEKKPQYAGRKTCGVASTVKRPGAVTLQKCPSDPTRLPSARKEYYTPSVAVLGLDEDAGDVKWTRMLPMPLRQGHARHHSDPASSTPCLSEAAGTACDELYLRGRSPSRNAALSSSEEYDDATPGGIQPGSSPPNRLTPLLPPGGSDRNLLRIPHMMKEDKRSTTPRMPSILDLEHQTAARIASAGSRKLPTPHSSPREPSKLAQFSTSELSSELPRLSDDDLRSSLAEAQKISQSSSNDSGVCADKITSSPATKIVKNERKQANVTGSATELTHTPTATAKHTPPPPPPRPDVSDEVKEHRVAQSACRVVDRDSGIYSDASPVQETQTTQVTDAKNPPKPERPPPPKIASVKAKPSIPARHAAASPHVQTKATMQNLAKQRRASAKTSTKPVARTQQEMQTVKPKVPAGKFEAKRPTAVKEVVVKQARRSDGASSNDTPQPPPRIKSQLRKAALQSNVTPTVSRVTKNESKVNGGSQRSAPSSTACAAPKNVTKTTASTTLLKTTVTATPSDNRLHNNLLARADVQISKTNSKQGVPVVGATQSQKCSIGGATCQSEPTGGATYPNGAVEGAKNQNSIKGGTTHQSSPAGGTAHDQNSPVGGAAYQESPICGATHQNSKNSATIDQNSPLGGVTPHQSSPEDKTEHHHQNSSVGGATHHRNSPVGGATCHKTSPTHGRAVDATKNGHHGSGNNSPTAGRKSSSPSLLFDCLLSKMPKLSSVFRRPSSEEEDRQSKLSTVHPEVPEVRASQVMSEYTGPVIQDAFESINRRQADQIRQMIADEEKAKSRQTASAVRKRSDSRPISSKRVASKQKPPAEDTKARRMKPTKKKVRKKKKVVEDEDEDEIACDERTDVIAVQGLGDDGSSDDDDDVPAYVPSPRPVINKRSPGSLPGQIQILSNDSADEDIEWCPSLDQIAAEIVFDEVVFDEKPSNPSTPRSRRTSVHEPCSQNACKISPRSSCDGIRRGSADSPRSPCGSRNSSPRETSEHICTGSSDSPRHGSHHASSKEIINRVNRGSNDSRCSVNSPVDSPRDKFNSGHLCQESDDYEKNPNALSHPHGKFDAIHRSSTGSSLHSHKASPKRMRHGSAECPNNRRTDELVKESRHVRHSSVDSQCSRFNSQNASLQNSFDRTTDAVSVQRDQFENLSKRSTVAKVGGTFITQSGDSPDSLEGRISHEAAKKKSVKSCVAKRDEAEINEMIEEILNSTPHPSLNLSHHSTHGSTERDWESVNRERHARMHASRQREQTFQQIGTAAAAADVVDDDVFSADEKTLTPDNSSGDCLELMQLTKLMNTLKNLQLRVDDEMPPAAAAASVIAEPIIAAKPPPPPAGSRGARPAKSDRTLERSPRFIRKHDSFREIKQPTEICDERSTSSQADHGGTDFSLCSLPDSLANESANQPATRSLSRSSSVSTSDDGELIQWRRGNMLGKGAYGTVWCGLTSQGKQVAVKQIELPIENLKRAEHEYEKVQQEVELLKTLQHVNIVAYLGTSLEDNIVSIFMQNVAGGSIANLIARFGALDEEVFCRYTTQILAGIEYLHSNNVIHRDIKGGNVMVNQDGVVKLIDFGCAKRLCINMGFDGSFRRILTSMKGTPYWMAPEVVMETGHGTKSDIWSVGCTVFEMSTKKPPWSEMPPMSAILAIGTPNKPIPQLPSKFSVEARDFVAKCLTRDPNLRPCATTLRSHAFITRRRNKK